MAVSAMMREAMPTFPRYGRFQASGVSRAGVVIGFMTLIALSVFLTVGPTGQAASVHRFAASLIGQLPIPPHSLVAAVGVFGMFQIPQRTAAGDYRDGSKVVRRGRGAYGPFESQCVPGIIPCRVSLPLRNDKVSYKQQD